MFYKLQIIIIIGLIIIDIIIMYIASGKCKAVFTSNLQLEGNVLFNDALNTFYLRLYGVTHMVKDHSESERKPAAATWATLSD